MILISGSSNIIKQYIVYTLTKIVILFSKDIS